MAYKVTYFNITALGEPIRLLLSYGKLEFEDRRVEVEEWPSLKPSTPMGQLPTLEYNGKVAHQSLAICRYLGKQVKLNGGNDWEDLEIDIAADTVNDFRQKIGLYHYEKEPELKEKKKLLLFDEQLPFYIGKLEEQVQKNNGYLAIGKLTWADIYFVGILEYLNYMLGKDLTDSVPDLKKLNEKVRAIPEIKAYLDKRPKTEM